MSGISGFVDISSLVPPPVDSANRGSGRGEEPSGGNPPPDSNPFSNAEFGKNLARLSRQFAAGTNRRFQFQKRSQLIIRMHDEPLSVIPMRVNDPYCSPATIHG